MTPIENRAQDDRGTLIGAVDQDPITRPEASSPGRYTDTGQLVIIGRSVPLSAASVRVLGCCRSRPVRASLAKRSTVISSQFRQQSRDRVGAYQGGATVVDRGLGRHGPAGWCCGVMSPGTLRYRPELHPR